MRFDRLIALAGLLSLLAGCMVAAPPPAIDGPSGLRLHTHRFGPARLTRPDTLVIVVNGDGAPADRNDDAAYAQALVAAIPNSVALTLLRPGYADAAGHVSPGDMGRENGENLGPDHMLAVAEAIKSAEAAYPGATHIIAGSSGGAALVADLAGLYPRLIDAIVLAGCPCTMPEWRRYRAKQAPGTGWSDPVDALDPLKAAGGVEAKLHALIVVGANDTLVPPRFSKSYAEALALRGITTDFRILPNRGADILTDPEVIAATARLAAQLRTPR